ncbi:helix-turn-helix domain-containing protein [Streptomyces sp. NPDC001404]|uniref:helix-turn-helix domain-containing protein n=1 Tax=Streptomyces sp. NPDC001404 TaxID=3364571 RepID=UPI0036B79390
MSEAPQPARGSYLTGNARLQEADRLADRYRAGETIRDIAANTGHSYGTTRNLLLLAQVKLRQRGGEPRPIPARRTAGNP